MATKSDIDSSCSIARSLSVLGGRWTLLILREATFGKTRFGGALQQWGDEHLPHPDGPTVLRRLSDTDIPVRVAFVDDHGHEVPRDAVTMIKTDSFPG